MPDPNQVVLTVPADARRLPLARVVAVSCAAIAGFGLDRIDDVRQCTQESLALLLEMCPGDEVEVRCWVHSDRLEVRASVTCGLTDVGVDESSFAWLLLTELADDARVQLEDGRLVVRFVAEAESRFGLATGNPQ